VSPGGHRVAFVARNASGGTLVWTRSLDTLAAQALAGTEGARSPFWSPDSRSVGFFAQGKLRKIAVASGPPVTLCDAAPGISGAWGDGVIVFSAAGGTPLHQVAAAGGTPSPVTKLGEGEAGHARPSFLPDGRHFVYRATAGPNAPRGPAFVASLGSPERTRLIDVDSTNVVYSRRHLLFLREAALMAQPFDPARLTLAGDAFPVAEQIQSFGSPPYGFFSASDAGVLVYQTGTAASGAQLTWLDRAGKTLATVGSPAAFGDLALFVDGNRAAVSLVDSQRNEDVWLLDLDRGGLTTRFTFDTARDFAPVWSQDGSRVAFASNRTGPTFDVYQKPASGLGSEEVLLADNVSKIPTNWSPDGRFLLYTLQTNQRFDDMWILPLSGDRKPVPFLQTRFNEGQGQFSPDGRWIAYVSNEAGPDQVYVAPFQGVGEARGGKWQVSTAGGTQPRWRGDGKEIFFVSPAPDNLVMAATVTPRDSGLEVGASQPLFAIRPSGTPRNSYQVSADGQRFLVNMGPMSSATPTPITVVVNWTANLKK
jgi:eukaryotic-like serine/threonine-protein kinase